MSGQLSMGEPPPETPSSHRVQALASILVGFAAPGFESWSRAPQAMRIEAMKAAEEALERMYAKREEIGL